MADQTKYKTEVLMLSRTFMFASSCRSSSMSMLGASLVLMLVIGCGGAAVPQKELVQAKSAVSASEARDASKYPRAALHLKMAKDQIEEAETLMAEDKNVAARMMLQRAHKDAELALEKSREAESAKGANEAVSKLRSIEERQINGRVAE